ncbi:hypothetical protein B6U82_01410 [Candidatus Pacearchaeota archaeon ex4484_31]|nr:MAG: hypothetical protein B6U82_01410 [Candidatus Pacearchaeota archaeon ex4484_31]
MLGLTIGISYTNITLTASAIAGKEVPWWQKILKGAQSTGSESSSKLSQEIANQTFNQSWLFPLCNNITAVIHLNNKHEVFLLRECEKAVYIKRLKKYEVILHEVIGNTAYIEYVEYIRGVPCNHQYLAISPKAIGFAVEVLKAFGPRGLPQVQDGSALLVMPRKMHEDYC